MRPKYLLTLFNLVILIIELFFFICHLKTTNNVSTQTYRPILTKRQEHTIGYDDEIIDFEGYDNTKDVAPFDTYIVPNYVHLIYLRINEIKFYQLVNIYSIFLNQNPTRIYIHCDDCDFKGYYWDQLNSINQIKAILIIHKVRKLYTIFGVQVEWIEHRSDVLRHLILMNYGGIYLDNDVYVVKSLDKYRQYEMTFGWEHVYHTIGSQVLIAHRNARFLRACFDSYRTNYIPNEWYYNAGQVPAKIYVAHPFLAHAVSIKLGNQDLVDQLYKTYWSKWKSLDTIHLLMNHRSYLDKEPPIKEFDEDNIKTYPFTYGKMARLILDQIKPYLTS